MPEEVSDVKQAPEPSTGQTLTPPADPEAYTEWRLTGKMPVEKKQPKKEDSAPSEPAEGESGEELEEPEEKRPAPEPGKKKQEHRKGSAEGRLNELLADLRRAGLTPSELKTFRREVAQAPPAPQPAQTSVNPPVPQKLTEPKLENFRTWEEFRAAERAYNAQQVDERIREAYVQMQAQQAQDQVNRQAAERLNEARQRYGEEAESSIVSAARGLFGDQSIHPAIKGIVNESPVIADLLYVMGSSQSDFDEFIQTARTNPGEALRRAVMLEQLVKDELRKSSSNGKSANSTEGERDESGRFLPAKREAPPPPAREVSGRASPPTNEADAAFNRGDIRAYMNAKNREQFAQKKGR